MRKLRLFTHKEFLPKDRGYLELLYPYWGMLEQPDIWKPLGIYGAYLRSGSVFFDISDNPTGCDYALLPNDWKRYVKAGEEELAAKFIALAESYHLQTIVFFHSDSDERLPFDNVIVFRTSLRKSKQRQNEFAMPGWSGDLLSYFNEGRLIPRIREEVPVLGFCGAAGSGHSRWQKKVKNLLFSTFDRKRYRFDAAGYRFSILSRLRQSSKIKPNFIIRSGYLGDFRNQGGNAEHIDVVRREYFQNSIESDYILCMRGVGNFSYRFYESLSLGRVPVFVNSESVLPFESLLDYKELVVWIEPEEIDIIDEKILAHFRGMNDNQFRDLQCRLRGVWKEFLSPEGFFSKLHRVL